MRLENYVERDDLAASVAPLREEIDKVDDSRRAALRTHVNREGRQDCGAGAGLEVQVRDFGSTVYGQNMRALTPLVFFFSFQKHPFC